VRARPLFLRVFLVGLPAALGLAGCASGGPCTTDAQCSNSSICVEVKTHSGTYAKRCVPTCSRDSDCFFAGRFGKDCRLLNDTASGPAAVEQNRIHNLNLNRTTRGTMKICRGPQDIVR